MKMNNNYLPLRVWLMLFLGLFSLPALAQINVSGTVIDETGATLPGVNVVIKGTATGTATDIDGKYQVSVPSEDAVLVFSYIGYSSQEILVGAQTTIDVQMQLDSETLEEVVVIGYGVQKKSDLTGSVTAIDSKEFNKGAMVSPQDLIVGRTAGVQVTTGGGAPGSGATIRIRGGSSLSASNNPLIVIDGTPIDTEGVSGMSNPLSAINPNDIESMTVLKDASATAIYGSRASNGVIIITTKRGKMGAPMKVGYTANVSMYTVPKTLDVLSASAFSALVTERSGNGSLPAASTGLLGDATTNWQDQVLESAIGTDHNISVSGALSNMPYRASVGYSNQNGILKTSNFQRTSFALGLDPSFLDNHLKVNINAKYSLSKSRFADQGAVAGSLTFDPTKPVTNENTDFGGYYYWAQATQNADNVFAPTNLAPANPLALLEQRNNTADVNRFIGNIKLNYKLPFLPDMIASLNLGLDRSSSDGSDITNQNAAFRYQAPFNDANGNAVPFDQRGGGRTIYSETKKNELLQFTLNYNKELPFANSSLSVLAGYEWQHFYRESATDANNFAQSNVTPFIDDFATENFLVSFFGRVNYGLADGRYMFTFTLRQDGSSRFLEDNRWGLFPAAAFAWHLKDESFLKDVNALSELKIRLGYGVTGQQNIGFGDYPALARVRTSEPTAYYQFGNSFVPTSRIEGFNANLKWEETTTYNVGLDFGFAKDRITGSIDWYNRVTKDLINVIPTPAGTNFINQIATNIGELENTGIEVGLNAIVVDKDDLTVEAGLNFSRNRNEITNLTLVDDPNYLGVATGGISGGTGNNVQIHSVGQPASTYFVYEQIYNSRNNMPIEGAYVDQNGDGIINDQDRIHYNNPAPRYYMGYSLRVNYKNLSLSANARLTVGNHVYNNLASNLGNYNSLNPSGGFLNNVLASSSQTEFDSPQFLSNFYVQDASFFRLDNVTLGYNFEKLIASKYDVYLNFTVQNAFVSSNYTGLDPEIDGGIDNNFYPRPRTYLLGLNVNF